VLRSESNGANDALNVAVSAEQLTTLLSVIAGMVDLTGFFTLGNLFTAHITGNLVLVAAAAVRGNALNLAQAFAIPVFMLAVAGTWLIARTSNKQGPALARLLLIVQLILLVAVLGFGVYFKPSANPHGLIAGIAAMLAVSAMACQYSLLRLALPKVVSTAVMTGNLTNAVLSLVDISWSGRSTTANAERLRLARIPSLRGCGPRRGAAKHNRSDAGAPRRLQVCDLLHRELR
jgi:uncharacterized membrane protein YoaK (UPF0700 family)